MCFFVQIATGKYMKAIQTSFLGNEEEVQIHSIGLWTDLLHKTQGSMRVDYVDHMGSDLMVVNAARVSFDKQKEIFDDSDKKLLQYLARNNHWTPFAHPQISLRITAPIPIRTQCFKHKQGFVENEISRRYVDTKPQFFRPVWRMRHKSSKQGSAENFSDPEQIQFKSLYEQCINQAVFAYEKMIESGVCPEQARFILPQGMETSWVWTGSLAAYSRFCVLRLDSHAQKEVRDIAGTVSEIVGGLFPHSWRALMHE